MGLWILGVVLVALFVWMLWSIADIRDKVTTLINKDRPPNDPLD